MRFHTLAALKTLAAERGKTLCCWRPHPLPHGLEADRWILDSTGVKQYRSLGLGVDVPGRSHRILVLKDGTVEGL